MSDINWHTDMQNCPNDIAVLIRYDDGDVDLVGAGDNDTDWAKLYPIRGPKHAGVSYPEAWAAIDPVEAV